MLKKIFKIFSRTSSATHSIGEAAFLISLAGILSRVLGLFRDRLLAGMFGAGDKLDAYYAAFRIPDLIYNLLIVGALSVAFIPVFSSLIAESRKDEAERLVNNLISIFLAVISIVSLVFLVFTPWLMKAIAPGFSGDKLGETIILTRIMFLSPFFLGVSALLGGVLVSHKKFFLYSFAPILYNIGIIFGITFFAKFFGLTGLAMGVVLGALLHMLIQYPSVASLGYKFKLSFRKTSWHDRNVRKIFFLIIPRVMGVAVSQINLVVITIFASFLTSGSLAVFTLATNLQNIPLGLFGIPFSVAAFPTMSTLAAEKSEQKFRETFLKTYQRILFFVIPASVFIFALRAQLVRVILGSGQFTWEDTQMTLEVLGILAMSLFAQSLIPLFARSFYALHDTKTPFYAALVGEAVNISSVLLLIGKYEIAGLAYAFSLSSIANVIVLLIMLRRRFDKLFDRKTWQATGKIILAAAGGAAVIQISKNWYAGIMHLETLDTFLEVFFQLAVSGTAGLLFFLLLSYLLGIEEFFEFKRSLLLRIFKRPAIETENLEG